MAIKIQGTSVIEDDRSLVNITTGTLTGTLTANGVSIPSGRPFLQNNTAYSAKTEYYFGGQTDLNWKKIADVSLPIGTFKAASFEIEFFNTGTNYGAKTDLNSSIFVVSCRRSASVQDDTDDALVSGPYEDLVRVVKTAVGIYEIQVRQLVNYRHNIVIIRCISTTDATITYPTTLVNGDTTGTIYTISRANINEGPISSINQLDTNYLTLGNAVNRASIVYNSNTAVTYTLPNIASNSEFLMTSGNQTISGIKTFTDNVVVSNRIVHNGSGDSEPRIELAPGNLSLHVGISNVFSINASGVASGTAVQNDMYDTTDHKIMLNGAHGLGAVSPTTTSNLNALVNTRFFYEANAIGTPGSGATVTGMHISGGNETLAIQIGSRVSADTLVWRRKNVNWQSWREIYTQASILGTVSISGGIPTGAIIERDNNANGEYVRFADGTQICGTTIQGNTAGAFTRTWPAEFSSAPRISAVASGTVPRIVTVSNNDGVTIEVHVWDTAGTRTNAFAGLIAFGRWF